MICTVCVSESCKLRLWKTRNLFKSYLPHDLNHHPPWNCRRKCYMNETGKSSVNLPEKKVRWIVHTNWFVHCIWILLILSIPMFIVSTKYLNSRTYFQHASTVQWTSVIVFIVCGEWNVVRAIPRIIKWITGISFISVDFQFVVVCFWMNFEVRVLSVSRKCKDV